MTISSCGEKTASNRSENSSSQNHESSSSSERVVEYSINWINYNDEVLLSEKYQYGETPSYKGSTPQRQGDAQYSYTFSTWEPEPSAVKGDATYKACYNQTLNRYTVTWKNYDGSVLDTESYSYGETPSYKGNTPTKVKDEDCFYFFSKWDKAIASVTENVEYIATFDKAYQITWKNYDGTVLATDIVTENSVPSYDRELPVKKDEGGQIDYTFQGWSPSIAPATEDAEYIAQFVAGSGFEFEFNGTNGYTLTKCFLSNVGLY